MQSSRRLIIVLLQEPIPFPGFQDAFGQRVRPARKDKGKGRAVISDSPIQEARLRTIPDTRFSDPFAEPAPLEETQQLGTLETDPGAPPNDTVDEGLEAPQDLPSFEWSNEVCLIDHILVYVLTWFVAIAFPLNIHLRRSLISYTPNSGNTRYSLCIFQCGSRGELRR